MLRNYFSLLLIQVLLIALLPFHLLAQPNEEKLKTQIVNWGLNKTVTAKLKSGAKLQGRVTEIKDEFFVLEVVQQGQSQMRQMQFSEIDKLSSPFTWDAQKSRAYIGLAGAIVLAGFVITNLVRSKDRKPKTIVFP